MTTRSYTRVQLTIEVTGSSYGPEWTVRDIVAQALLEVPSRVKESLRSISAEVIGEPVVKVITVVSEGK